MTAAHDDIGRRSTAASGITGWLGLAAAPTFAAMALVTATAGADPTGMPCMMASHASPLTGMAAMYLLMSVFHLAPWLRLAARARRMADEAS
ncbi:MAG: hypothetical protein OJF62_003293 [Pseudolabrys sp.]|jgi:hypothetical protein|nr:hypothetical protein [Pseudolabrys sp.]